MAWRLAADLVVMIHLLWIVFLICGALIGRKVAWVKWVHIAALVFSVLLQLFNWICPLTYLEIWFRSRHDPGLSYTGEFIAHYAESLVYLRVPRTAVFGVTLIIIGLSTWAYWPTAKRP